MDETIRSQRRGAQGHRGDSWSGLPEDYHAVFESLSDQELAALMLLKARLRRRQGPRM